MGVSQMRRAVSHQRVASSSGCRGRAGALAEIRLRVCRGRKSEAVEFCHGLGMDYVSCSPYRVPIARLAAAQAALEQRFASKTSLFAAFAKATLSEGMVKASTIK